LRDEIRQPIYDTIDIQAGESPVADRDFFANVQGKSLVLTNLRQNKLLETAVSFRVQGLTLDAQNIYAANIAVLPLIMESSSISLKVGEKFYFQSPATFVAGRLEQSAAAATTVAATTISQVYQHLGQAAVAPVVLQGKHVVDINPLQSFDAMLSTSGMTAAEIAAATPVAATKLRLIFSLKGLQRRPVQ
jgi:hypothetical protein